MVSVPRSGRGGREFKSPHPDHKASGHGICDSSPGQGLLPFSMTFGAIDVSVLTTGREGFLPCRGSRHLLAAKAASSTRFRAPSLSCRLDRCVFTVPREAVL